MNWLITYTQDTGGQIKYANEITPMRPGYWLSDMLNTYQDAETILHSAIEITDEEYDSLINII